LVTGNFYEGKTMKAILFFILLIIIPSCYTVVEQRRDETSTINKESSINSKVLAEGLVKYFESPIFQTIHHSGYLLQNLVWIVPPEEQRVFVFLEPNELVKNFEHEHVRVEGLFSKIPGRRINSYTYVNEYYIIMIDSIYVLK
jgi:hypothetical protein